MPSGDVECNREACDLNLTDAPLASAVELRALQSIVVTVLMREVLMVVMVVVVLAKLVLLDDIISRTSSKTEGH